MTDVAVENHRAALFDTHTAGHYLPAAGEIQRQLLANHPGHLPYRDQPGLTVALDDHVVTPAWPDGVRYLRNIDLVAVVRAAPLHRDVGDLYAAMLAAQPGIGMPDFLGALSTLIARGALRHTA